MATEIKTLFELTSKEEVDILEKNQGWCGLTQASVPPAVMNDTLNGINNNVVERLSQPHNELHIPSNVAVGDVIEFGAYPQDSDTPSPLKWYVVEVADGKALLLSQKIIDTKRYGDKGAGDTWEKCSLRKWLNEEFLMGAFTEGEKSKICLKHNDNPDNRLFKVAGGKATDDYITCLSTEEAKKVPGKIRGAKVTEYAKRHGCRYVQDDRKVKDNGIWWLRSPGQDRMHHAYVNASGYVGGASIWDLLDADSLLIYMNNDFGVRPALWLIL